MNEVKKPVRGRLIAVVVAVCLLVGSAFALTPSIQQVMMPDHYGIMPLMLDDENLNRTVALNGKVGVGYTHISYGDDFTYVNSQTFDISGVSESDGYNLASGFLESASQVMDGKFYLVVNAGTYVDYSVDVSFSPSDYKSLVVSGGFEMFFEAYPEDTGMTTLASYPSTYQLLINGSPAGTIFSGGYSGATFADQAISITSEVTSIGVRCSWNSGDSVSDDINLGGNVELNLWWNDELSVIPSTDSGDSGGGDTGGGDTGGGDSGSTSGSVSASQVERVIAWQQNTYTAVNDIKSVLNPNNSGSVGSYIKDTAEDTSNIASIFAREDDIKLRDDMDSTLKEATSSFWSPAGEGETETEFDKATKVDKQKVTDIKNVGKGASALFDTGYGITDGFEAIATDDSFMSWFTAETANALDSTGQAVTVGDDDPYNMHFYYDQMQAIQKARGND